MEERPGLGHARSGEVVDDRGLEADVRVCDDKRAQHGVHDGVERAGSEGGDGDGDEAETDESGIGLGLVFSLGDGCGLWGTTHLSKDQW